MNIDNWNYIYKIRNNIKGPTNLLYTPLVNLEKTILCMDWGDTKPYHSAVKRPSAKLIDYFFQKEVELLTEFQGKYWAPTIIDVIDKKIFIEWNDISCNSIIFDSNKDIDKEFINWKDQLSNVIQDIYDFGFLKLSLYSHCFYFDKNKSLKTIDFYSCFRRDQPLIERSFVEELIGVDSLERFNAATTNGYINFEIFFKNTLKSDLVNSTWNNSILSDIVI